MGVKRTAEPSEKPEPRQVDTRQRSQVLPPFDQRLAAKHACRWSAVPALEEFLVFPGHDPAHGMVAIRPPAEKSPCTRTPTMTWGRG